jgi:hypothetical protein
METRSKYAISQIELDDDEDYEEELKSYNENKTEGVKYDNRKADYSLVPPKALDDVVKVLTFGAEKYDRHNWKKLENLEDRYFAAAQRHLWAVMRGETHDPESGEHHYAHALCCIMYLLEFYSLQNPKNSI